MFNFRGKKNYLQNSWGIPFKKVHVQKKSNKIFPKKIRTFKNLRKSRKKIAEIFRNLSWNSFIAKTLQNFFQQMLHFRNNNNNNNNDSFQNFRKLRVKKLLNFVHNFTEIPL